MTERIFEVEISNKTSKGYETATALEMPATWAEFHDALEKARIKDARDCHNELTKIEYPGIQRGMIGDNVNLYELNLLAQRLAMLSEDDRMGLDGLLQIEGGRHIGPIPLPRLINLTYNADICLLAPHVFNNQQLGALLYESGMLTQEAMTLLDTTEDGSYLVFTAMTDETTLAAVEKPGIPLPILIGGAVAAVLLVILSILGHKHRKKRLAEKAEQERKRDEETDNGWFY